MSGGAIQWCHWGPEPPAPPWFGTAVIRRDPLALMVDTGSVMHSRAVHVRALSTGGVPTRRRKVEAHTSLGICNPGEVKAVEPCCRTPSSFNTTAGSVACVCCFAMRSSHTQTEMPYPRIGWIQHVSARASRDMWEDSTAKRDVCVSGVTARLVSLNHVPLQQRSGTLKRASSAPRAHVHVLCRAPMGCAQNAGTSSANRTSFRVHRLSPAHGRPLTAAATPSGAQTHALARFH